MDLIRTIPLYVFMVSYISTLGLGCIITPLLGDRKGIIWWPLSRLWARGFLYTSGVTEITIKNQEALDSLTSIILMSNHESHIDPPLLIWVSRKNPLRFLTKHTLFYSPIFGLILLSMGHIPVNRSNPQKAFHSLKKAGEKIRKGRTVCIFPEGTRSPDGNLLPFKKGGFITAIQGQIPILPVGIAGTHDIMPKGVICRKKGPVGVVIGNPISTEGFTLERSSELMEIVKNSLNELRAEAVLLIESKIR